jgi:hypothetical protein
VQEHTLHPGIGHDHRAARQEPPVQDAHLDEALTRRRPANVRFQEARDILTQAAADLAHQRPSRTPGDTRSTPRAACVAWGGSWPSRAGAMTRGVVAHPAPRRMPPRRGRPPCRTLVPRAGAPTAHAGSRLLAPQRADASAAVALAAGARRPADAATHGRGARHRRPPGRPRRGPHTSSPES